MTLSLSAPSRTVMIAFSSWGLHMAPHNPLRSRSMRMRRSTRPITSSVGDRSAQGRAIGVAAPLGRRGRRGGACRSAASLAARRHGMCARNGHGRRDRTVPFRELRQTEPVAARRRATPVGGACRRGRRAAPSSRAAPRAAIGRAAPAAGVRCRDAASAAHGSALRKPVAASGRRDDRTRRVSESPRPSGPASSAAHGTTARLRVPPLRRRDESP